MGLHPQNILQKALMRRWNSFFDNNVVPSFRHVISTYAVSNNSEEFKLKLNAFRDQINFLSKYSQLSERPKSKFFWGDSPTLTDIVLLPHLQSLTIVSKNLFGINLLEDDRESSKADMEAFSQWYISAVSNFEALQSITNNLRNVPLEKSIVLRDLGVLKAEDFNYEQYVTSYYRRKYIDKK